jgi:hypothetical protein
MSIIAKDFRLPNWQGGVHLPIWQAFLSAFADAKISIEKDIRNIFCGRNHHADNPALDTRFDDG